MANKYFVYIIFETNAITAEVDTADKAIETTRKLMEQHGDKKPLVAGLLPAPFIEHLKELTPAQRELIFT